jgi:hypothetical protein
MTRADSLAGSGRLPWRRRGLHLPAGPLPATRHGPESIGGSGCQYALNAGRIVLKEKGPGVVPGPFQIAEAMIADQVFIESKNSEFCLVWRSLSKRNSIASCGPIGLRMRRST